MVDKNKLIIRSASFKDLADIVELLANDPLGANRESFTEPLNRSYIDAFNEICEDKNAELLIVEYQNNIIGTAQINYVRYLTYQGGSRAQIEAVRIHEDYRGQGIGEFLFNNLIDRARSAKCHMVQLTTDKTRPAALGFYQKLGFKLSHDGLKLRL